MPGLTQLCPFARCQGRRLGCFSFFRFLPSCSASALFSSTHRLSVEVRIAVGGQVCICLSLIPQMGELRLREVKSSAQRHSTAEWQSPGWPGWPSPSKLPSPFFLALHLPEIPPHRLSGKPHSCDFLKVLRAWQGICYHVHFMDG